MESQKTGTKENSVQSNSTAIVEDAGSLSPERLENEQAIDFVQVSREDNNQTGVERNGWNGSESDGSRQGAAALAVILAQLVGYFSGKADVDDLDVLSFSLHHLFSRFDLLFRQALPALMQAPEPGPQAPLTANHLLARRHNWHQLHIINRALDRMEPLCHLLSDAAECILGAFDGSTSMILAAGAEQARTSSGATVGAASEACAADFSSFASPSDEQDWPHMFDQERWQQALTTITASLIGWEERYHSSLPFVTQFAYIPAIAPSSLAQLDSAFAILLDCAGAIFGDILPSFRTVSQADDASIAALLFDLMQQSDQLLVQFEITLEPINALLQQFSIRNATD